MYKDRILLLGKIGECSKTIPDRMLPGFARQGKQDRDVNLFLLHLLLHERQPILRNDQNNGSDSGERYKFPKRIHEQWQAFHQEKLLGNIGFHPATYAAGKYNHMVHQEQRYNFFKIGEQKDPCASKVIEASPVYRRKSSRYRAVAILSTIALKDSNHFGKRL